MPYEGDNYCTWSFDVDASDTIELSFDFFNLSDCKYYDYVQIGGKRFCGSEKPSPMTLRASDTIVFRSSVRTIRKHPGFKATYKIKSKYECWGTVMYWLAPFDWVFD